MNDDGQDNIGDGGPFRAVGVVLAVYLAAAAVFLVGCGGKRESAKAATMAEHSLAAAQALLEEGPKGGDPMAAREWLDQVFKRLVVARQLLVPVRARLAVGEDPVALQTGTSPEQALEDPAAFDAVATRQTAAADTEARESGALFDLWIKVKGIFEVTASSALGVVLGGSGVGLGAVALIGKGLQVYKQAKAVADEAVAYGNQVTEELKRTGGSQAQARLSDIKKEAVERQAKAGVWQQIDRIAKAKRAAPSTDGKV